MAADRFPVAEAQIVALFMEAVAYGIYLVTLGLCVRALFWGSNGHKERYNWPLVVVAGLMAVFATFDVAFGLRHNLDAFIFYKGGGGPDVEFEDISYWVNVMKTVDVQIMTLIGDGMLIYRCLVIFSHRYIVVAFPALLWLANAVCSAIIIYITHTLRSNALLSVDKLSPFLTSFLVITLVTNVLTTGLIVWRIWCVSRQTASIASLPKHGRLRLSNVIRILVESGFMYTSLVLITFGTELAGSNAIYGVSDVMVIVVGISFNLIIVRVDQGTAVGATYVETAPAIPLHFRSTRRTVSEGMGVEILVSSVVDRSEGEVLDSTKDDVSLRGMPKNRWDV